MAVKRRGLGKGLDALLAGSVPVGELVGAGEGDLRLLPVDLLQRGKYQPRQDMRAETLEELADSIRAQGVVQPVVVRPFRSEVPGARLGESRYELIAGERRWRAAQMAGLTEIPAVIRDVPDQAAVAIAIIENVQRENLNPLEEARALERLIDEFDMTHQQAAEAVGRSRTTVTNLVRLLDLGDEVKAMVERRELEMGHARALLALPSRQQQAEAAARVVSRGLSVRETERLVKRLLAGNGRKLSPPASVDPDIQRLETDLAEKLGAKVSLRHSASGKGKLVIDYNSVDELDGILKHIR